MKVIISFKHLDHTLALDQKIREKSEHIEKFLETEATLRWTCYVKSNQHYAELSLTGSHFRYHATANSDNLYKTLDLAIAKLEKQMSRKKEIWKNKLHRQKRRLRLVESDDVWENYKQFYDEDYKKAA